MHLNGHPYWLPPKQFCNPSPMRELWSNLVYG